MYCATCLPQTKRALEKQVDKLQAALDLSNDERRTAQREQEHARALLEKELAEVNLLDYLPLPGIAAVVFHVF